MKHTKKKRLLAIVLCMILVLSTGIAAFANENVGLQSVACQAATLERVIKNAEGEDVGMYRPPKVRPKNLTIGGRYFYG